MAAASRGLAIAAVLFGVSALAGWLLGVPALARVAPHVIEMRPNTALGVGLLGGAVLLDRRRAPRWARMVSAAASAFAVVLGVLTLAEHALGWDPGVDALLWPSLRDHDLRIAPITAVALVLIGLAVLARRLPGRVPGRRSQLLAIAAIAAVAPTLLGYFYDAPSLVHVAWTIPMAPNSAVAMAILGAAILAARPDEWLVGVITDDTIAGRTVRLLAPPAIVVPLVLGWLRLLGERAGLYSTAVGTAMFAVSLALIFVWLLVWQALALGRKEEALRRHADLLEQSHDAMVVWELGGRIVYWNRGAEELYGWPASRAVGRVIHELFETRRAEGTRAIEAILARDGRWEGELGHVTRDGRERWVESRLSAVRYGSGPLLVLETARDVTERRRAEAEREFLLESERAARTEAERAARARDEFVATVSHELRTPLHAILGWAGMLGRGTLDAASAERAIEVIDRNARAQAQMIEDLLDVSRIASGKLRLDVQEVDLAGVCEHAAATIQPIADAKEVRLELVRAPRVGVLRGDAGRISQVVGNLLSNAVKFTPPGGRVELALRRAGHEAEITVRDTGAGIDPEFLPYVFDRFRQADASITRTHGGLGLGLAIVRHIVELHGGGVRAESEGAGRGATFVVTLPLAASAAFDVEPSRAAGDGVSLRGLRVLLVDDQADARDLVQRMLEEHEAEVRAVGSAASALDEVQRFHPDVLLSDIGMPEQDGYQLVRELRALGPERGGDTPAAALTAFARPEDRRLSLDAGYQAHVTKPVERLTLIGVVADLARRAAA